MEQQGETIVVIVCKVDIVLLHWYIQRDIAKAFDNVRYDNLLLKIKVFGVDES